MDAACRYENYIFDLYGTLIDIHTDEQDPVLWKNMVGIYSRFGADYSSPVQIQETYEELNRKKFAVYGEMHHTAYPEIDISEVFWELYEKAPRHHESMLTFDDTAVRFAAESFRAISISRLGLYPGTLPALKRLRDSGAHIYLLSNAQRYFTWSELEMTGLLLYFDGVYISSDYGMKKPEPRFMEQLLKEYNLDKQKSVMVGNEIGSDIAIACACGMDSVYLNTGKYAVPQVQRDLAAVRNKYGRVTNRFGRTESKPAMQERENSIPETSIQIIWSGDLREIV